MVTTKLDALSEEQLANILEIPALYREKLKKMTLDEQLDCIYLCVSESSCNITIVNNVDNGTWVKYFKLSEFKESNAELFVFENMIVGLKPESKEAIGFTQPLVSTYTRSGMSMDSHTHRWCTDSMTVKEYRELVVFMNHEKLQAVADEYKKIAHKLDKISDFECTVKDIVKVYTKLKLHDSYFLSLYAKVMELDYCIGCRYLGDYWVHKYRIFGAEWFLGGARKGDLYCISKLLDCVTWIGFAGHKWTYAFLEELLEISNKYDLKDIEEKTKKALSEFNH